MKALIGISSYCLFCATSMSNELNIYGQAHLSIDKIDNDINSSTHVTSNSSRLGFNGNYEISNDLFVIFQYESGVDLTAQGGNDGNGSAESSGQIFTKGRPSYLGIKGHFGEALVGHMPFLDQWANDYNLFADQIGDLGNLWEASGIPGRSDNVIYYKTPNYQGLNVSVSYVPEEGVNDSDLYLLTGHYKRKGIAVSATYTNLGPTGASNNDQSAYAITASYQLNHFTIGGGFQQEQDISGISDNDRESITLGGSLKIGPNSTIKMQFANSSSDNQAQDAKQFAIGYDYTLGKNATIYLAYATMKNDDNVNFSVNGKGHGDKVVPISGMDPKAISFGLVYHFNHKLK